MVLRPVVHSRPLSLLLLAYDNEVLNLVCSCLRFTRNWKSRQTSVLYLLEPVLCLDSDLMMDWHVTGVELPHTFTASHQPSADTRCCQDHHPQCCLIAAGLLQYTTACHICHQRQQAASNTEHTGQGDMFCQRHGVTQTTTLVVSTSTNNIQHSSHYI